VRPRCGQPSDRRRLKSRTVRIVCAAGSCNGGCPSVRPSVLSIDSSSGWFAAERGRMQQKLRPHGLFKLAVTAHQCLNGRAPPHLSEHCIPVSSADTRRHVRSANRHLLAVGLPRFPLNTYGRRTCSRVTSASSTLGVLNDYALYKSTHSLTHSLMALYKICVIDRYLLTAPALSSKPPAANSDSVTYRVEGRGSTQTCLAFTSILYCIFVILYIFLSF